MIAPRNIVSPTLIYDFIASRVVGQESAKRTIALAGFLHMAKVCHSAITVEDTPPIRSSNALIMGPSGCGKTYIVQNMAEYLKLPYLELNARALTVEGYKGMSLNDHLEDWYHSTPSHKRRYLKNGVIFIDEFDKLCSGYGDKGWSLSLQHSLLKIIEGSHVKFPEKDGGIDTHRMLFVLGGNFEQVRNNVRKPKSIGFVSNTAETPTSSHQELVKAGVIQEIIGRISLITEVENLQKKDLKKALVAADYSIYKRYQELYKVVFGKELELSPYQVDKIIEMSASKNIGARGLHSSLDQYLAKTLFDEEINFEDLLDDLPDYN